MKTQITTYPLNNIVLRSKKKKKDVAREMGVTEQRLYKLIQYPLKMRIEQAIKMAEILNVSVNKIVKISQS